MTYQSSKIDMMNRGDEMFINVESSEILKRKVIKLSQLELMIGSGAIEYQCCYDRLNQDIVLAPLEQVYFARKMLVDFFNSRRLEMSEIEQSVYSMSINKLTNLGHQRFTAHKNLVKES